MEHLARHTGAWTGPSGFRLLPDEPFHHEPARAQLSLAAGGHLTTVAYTWSHPQDGEQEGLLVVGAGETAGTVTALWGDSWHQHPQPRALTGTRQGHVLEVSYAYSGDWRWTVALDTSDEDALLLRMDNTIPASAASASMAAGTYAAMAATLSRG